MEGDPCVRITGRKVYRTALAQICVFLLPTTNNKLQLLALQRLMPPLCYFVSVQMLNLTYLPIKDDINERSIEKKK